MSFLGSLIYSIFLQDNILFFHSNDKYNMFIYSIVFFVIGGSMLLFIPRYENTCLKVGDLRDVDGWEYYCATDFDL